MFVVASRLPSVTRVIVHSFPSSISHVLNELRAKPEDTEEPSQISESSNEDIPTPVPIANEEEDVFASGGESSTVSNAGDDDATAETISDEVKEDSDTEDVRILTEDDSDAAVTADPASDELIATGTEDAAATTAVTGPWNHLTSAFDSFVRSRDLDKGLDLDEFFSAIPAESLSQGERDELNEVKKLFQAVNVRTRAHWGGSSTEDAVTSDDPFLEAISNGVATSEEGASSEEGSTEDASSEEGSSEDASSEEDASMEAVPIEDDDSAATGDDAEVTVMVDYPLPTILPYWTVTNIIGLVLLGMAFVLLVTMMILSLASILYGCADPEDDDSTVLLYEDNTKTPLLKSYVVEYSPKGQHVNPVAVYVPPAAK
ncbi:hypothetical protein CLOP_g25132 [Closterium sp. NIES-67]|nr:hypothetical protein CLOP_g25132 [Closterium sp. NIES-67]